MIRSKVIISSGADTGKKKWTSSKFPGFPILFNIYRIFHNTSPIFHNVSPIFHLKNFSRFASANVAVVWIRACELKGHRNWRRWLTSIFVRYYAIPIINSNYIKISVLIDLYVIITIMWSFEESVICTINHIIIRSKTTNVTLKKNILP